MPATCHHSLVEITLLNTFTGALPQFFKQICWDSSDYPFKYCFNLPSWLCQKPIRQHSHRLLSFRAVLKSIWGWWPCPLTQQDWEGSEKEWKEKLLFEFLNNYAKGLKKALSLTVEDWKPIPWRRRNPSSSAAVCLTLPFGFSFGLILD